jgi:hypothetical protein
VLTLPYLVLMKLLAGRVQDTADVTRMLGAAEAHQVAEVRKIVALNEPNALEDLESLVALGRLEREGE